ncbi:hypothetical protein OH76DRAFT_1423330 [Lentinus brumalis]|uniref:Homeobox domain-containing protein n=1 Tax=Lentinus brumalis TaxID=2498619 RepID=A0A371CLD9_9APHY|nr:hypothetical protein OH76DRAFT_1423330 [Polyporus brumalis]
MDSPYSDDDFSIYYRPPTAGQISSESALGNWDGSQNHPPGVHPASMGTLAPTAPFFESPQVIQQGRNDPRISRELCGQTAAAPSGYAPRSKNHPPGVHPASMGTLAPTAPFFELPQVIQQGRNDPRISRKLCGQTAAAPSGYAPRSSGVQHAYSGADTFPGGSMQDLAPEVGRNAMYSYGIWPESGTAVPTAGRAVRYQHTDEGPSAPIAVNVPAAPSVAYKYPRVDIQKILGDFYRDETNMPSYKERVALSESTGMLTDDIKTWFQTKRRKDPNAETGRRNRSKPHERPSAAQKVILENYFVTHGIPNKSQRIQLAEELGMGTERIHNWYEHYFVTAASSLRNSG